MHISEVEEILREESPKALYRKNSLWNIATYDFSDFDGSDIVTLVERISRGEKRGRVDIVDISYVPLPDGKTKVILHYAITEEKKV